MPCSRVWACRSPPVCPDFGGAGDDEHGCLAPSFSDKGPSEDPRPEERPVEGEALFTPHFSPPPHVSSPPQSCISFLSLPNTGFGGGCPVGCLSWEEVYRPVL